jgi:hypothetical protein
VGVDTGEDLSMTERSRNGTEVMMRLPEQFLESVIVFKKANMNFTYIFLSKKAYQFKTIFACTESIDLILKAKKYFSGDPLPLQDTKANFVLPGTRKQVRRQTHAAQM